LHHPRVSAPRRLPVERGQQDHRLHPMSRPTVPNIQNQTSGWDAVVNNLKDVALNGPFPMVVATSVAALTTNFPANAYDYCFAIVNHGTYGHSLYISDGTNWRHYSTFHKTPHRTIS